MRQALLILRKDIRHLWPRAVVFVVLEAIHTVVDASVPRNPELANGSALASFGLWLAAAFVVISVIHEDRLVGDRQFWITRPYGWKSLALAKALFLLLFINLPVLLGQIAALAANGLSPLHYFTQLLLRQLTLASGMLLGSAAVAVVTASLVQVVIAVLAAYVGLIVVMMLAVRGSFAAGAQGSVDPVFGIWQTALALLFASGAYWLQYTRRSLTLARCLVACALAASTSLLRIAPWHPAFALLERSSPPVDSSVALLSPDYARHTGSPSSFPIELGTRPVLVPIQVTGIPDGMEVYSERVKVSMEGQDGEGWSSGWNSNNYLVGDATPPTPIHRLLPGAGEPYWLQMDVDNAFLGKTFLKPVYLRATVAFTLLGRARTARMTAWGRPEPVGGDFCVLSKFGGVSCLALFQNPTLSLVRFQPPPPAPPVVNGNLEGMENVGGSGTVFSIWKQYRAGVGIPVPAEPAAVSSETRQAVAHFERTLDMPDVVLRDR